MTFLYELRAFSFGSTRDSPAFVQSKRVAVPRHVLYVDDIFIFCRGTEKNPDNIKALLKRYSEASSQVISCEKSPFFAGFILEAVKNTLKNIIGFSMGHSRLIILGFLCLKESLPKFIFSYCWQNKGEFVYS